MLLLYVFCLILFLYYLNKHKCSYWESRNVPFDKPFLFFGSFYEVMTRKQPLHEKICELYNKFNTPYFGIYILNQPRLILRDPNLIKRVLVQDFDKFVNRKVSTNESVDPIGFHAIFNAQNQIWRHIREKLSPIFTAGKIKLMLPLMNECAVDFMEYFNEHVGVLDLKDVTKRYSVDVISSCAFGINGFCSKTENSEIMNVADKLMDPKSFIRRFSLFCFFFAPKLISILRLKFVDYTAADYFMEILKKTMKERREKKIVRQDVVAVLSTLQENETFDDVKIAAQALVFFLAGNDTISLTLTFLLYELAFNKDVQNRLRDEINKHDDVSYESLQELKYLDMVISETLRKYPLSSYLNRKSESKYTFEETGFTLDENMSVLVPVAGLHYDPEYFPNPDKFDPERFNDQNKAMIKSYTYLPFGDGPRNCIGQRFGLLATKVALVHILRNFKFEKTMDTVNPLQFDPAAMFLEPKNGVIVRVIKIKQHIIQ